MNDDNPANDFATGQIEIDREAIEIPSETLSFPGAVEGSTLDLVLDFDVEWLPGDDYVVFVIANGLKVHASYSDRDAVLNWVYERLQQLESFAEVQSFIAEAVREYERLVVLGSGSWVRGHVIESSRLQREATR